MDKVSYCLGLSVAHNMIQSGVKKIQIEDFVKGFSAAIKGEKPEIEIDKAGDILNDFFANLEAENAAEKAEIGDAMKKDGENFLAENAKKDGVVTLKSGLQYKILKEGKGRKAGPSSKVKCNYEGKFTNGQVFDSSY